MESGSPARPTILVVDDDPGIRVCLHLILDDEYRVLEAVDGAQALAMLATKEIDLVLLDLVMSGTDGFEVLEHVTKADKEVPVVVLSALNTAWTAATAMRWGAVDYVTKPFNEEVLLFVVRDALASARTPVRPIPKVVPARVVLVGFGLGIQASLSVLLRLCCRIERAQNLDQAIGDSSLQPGDVIIVDSNSLGENGVETALAMRKLYPTMHLVVVGWGQPQEKQLSRPSANAAASARVSSLLKEISARLNTLETTLPACSRRTMMALDYLGDHYATASLYRLGRAIGIAPHYLSTLFKTEIGLSPRIYISQLRLEAAKWLLAETEEKLESVAAQVGLHDASHLSRFFLKHTGDRPGSYRRRLKKVFTRSLWFLKILPMAEALRDGISTFGLAVM